MCFKNGKKTVICTLKMVKGPEKDLTECSIRHFIHNIEIFLWWRRFKYLVLLHHLV